MKTDEDSSRAVKGGRRYSVRFEGTRKVSEFSESEIIGPGFQNVSTSKLRPGQNVYITYCNREVQGSVVCHRPTVDQVIIRLLVNCVLFMLLITRFQTWKNKVPIWKEQCSQQESTMFPTGKYNVPNRKVQCSQQERTKFPTGA